MEEISNWNELNDQQRIDKYKDILEQNNELK